MTEDQIKHMVDRFLSWSLPENFHPDSGISFTRRSGPMPTGTNLFMAYQAAEMVRHMLEGLPEAAEITRLRSELARLQAAGRAVVEEWDTPFDYFEELAVTMEGPINALRTALEGEEGK